MARFRRIFDGGVEANRKCAAHPNSAARSGKKRLSTTAPLFKSPTHHQKAFTIARICMSCVRVCVSLCVCVCGASRFPGTSWASVSDEEGFSFSTSTSMEIVLIDFIVGLFQRPAATTWHAHDSRKSRREFPSYKKNPTYSITNPENKTNTIKIQSLLKRKLATQRKSNSRSEWTELPLINHCKSKETNEKRKKIYLKTTRVQVDCQTESRFIGYGNETKQEAYVGKSNEYHYTWSITGSRRLCGNRRDPWKFVSKRNHRIMNADQVCLVSYEGVQWVRLSEPGASVAIVFVAAAAAAAAVVVVFSLQPLLLLLLLLLAWAEEKKEGGGGGGEESKSYEIGGGGRGNVWIIKMLKNGNVWPLRPRKPRTKRGGSTGRRCGKRRRGSRPKTTGRRRSSRRHETTSSGSTGREFPFSDSFLWSVGRCERLAPSGRHTPATFGRVLRFVLLSRPGHLSRGKFEPERDGTKQKKRLRARLSFGFSVAFLTQPRERWVPFFFTNACLQWLH